jgi:hypothetical protein
MEKLKNVSGWLSPSGEFFKCFYTEHWDKAKELCKQFKYKIVLKDLLNKDPELTLELAGWVKLSLGSVEYNFAPGIRLTKKQLDFIFDYLMANGRNLRRYEQIIKDCN